MRTPEQMLEQIRQLVRAISAAKYPRDQVRFPVTRDEAFDLNNHLESRSTPHGDDGPNMERLRYLDVHGIRCSWGDVDFREIL